MKMFLAGRWVDKPQKAQVTNPFDGSVIDTVPKGDAADVEAAMGGAVAGPPKCGARPAISATKSCTAPAG